MRDYRNAFISTFVVAMALAAGLVWVGWRYVLHRDAPTARAQPAVALSSASGNSEAPGTIASNAPSPETPLVPVQLTPERIERIGIKTGVVEEKPVHDVIPTVGDVEVDEERLAYVQVRFAGWIQKVYANSTYQYIRKGQPLFTIYSPELVTTEQEYLLAEQNRNALARSSVPGVATGAVSLLDAAIERLKQWEIPEREIAKLEATGQVQHELEIDSPVSGYITERNALPNMYVQPETRLYAAADLSTVWVYAQVFQNDIGRLKVGDPATVTVDAYPGLAFSGRLNYIWPQVDMTTRTVRVRLVFPNPGVKLKPGMFVNVRLDVQLGRQLTIPASGVFRSGRRAIAFVDHGGGYLEPRDIELGPQAADEVIILKGLRAGERIVTSANFLVDSESQLQAALGSFAPPPPGAGAAAAMNAPTGAAQASIEFTSDPSPPHKGDNTFRVTLKNASGAPISGAQVTVTFFMPAMPAMGMAAMRIVANLSDKGGGMYEGAGKLESGGTWQVTILAQKNGQTIAAKSISLNAEGGM